MSQENQRITVECAANNLFIDTVLDGETLDLWQGESLVIIEKDQAQPLIDALEIFINQKKPMP